MSFFEDMIYVNKSVLEKTVKSISKNWMIILTGFLYTVINIVLYNLLGILFRGPISILSGIASALITSSLISNYLYLLFNIVSYNRLTVNNFQDGFTYYVRKIYGVLFVAYIGRLLLSFAIPILGPIGISLGLLLPLILGVGLNALPETVYLKDRDAWESIVYSLEFLRDNWINWLIPNVVFYGAIYLIIGKLILGNVFNTHIGFNFSTNIIYIVRYLIAQVIFSFMMIYRGHLYKILSTSTRRKRMFMKKI